jgi:hypothetical protein
MPRHNRRYAAPHHNLDAHARRLDRLARRGRLPAPIVPLDAPGSAGLLTAAAAHGSPVAGATDAGPHVTAEPSGLLVARFRPAFGNA